MGAAVSLPDGRAFPPSAEPALGPTLVNALAKQHDSVADERRGHGADHTLMQELE
jgi:hypothetical protein